MFRCDKTKSTLFFAFLLSVCLQGIRVTEVLAQSQGNDSQSVASSYQDEHEHAVRIARDGRVNEGLALLQKLHQDHPNDINITRDVLVASGWAGHDQDVIKIFETLPSEGEPDFVYAAVGLSYRNLHQPNRAYDIYRLALHNSPDNTSFMAGAISSLTDAGQFDNALNTANAALERHGDRPEILSAAANAADTVAEKDPHQKQRLYQAFRLYQRALEISPGYHEALKGYIHVTDLIGMPQVALDLANKNPGLLSNTEYRRIEGDEAAAFVRWGVLEPKDETSRYEETDKAIARLDSLISKWGKSGKEAYGDVLRARLDRIVAYRDRNRMQDVIEEYNALRAVNVLIPPYVLSAVADAYLYLRHPEKARDLALKVLDQEPNNFEARRQLFYAYVECDDFDNAYTTIDQLDRDQGIWIRLKGLATPLPNSYRAVADLDSSVARLYGGELEDAEDKISAIAFAAPNNSQNRKALGDIYDARGWPRAAAEEYAIGRALQEDGKDVSNETGLASMALELQNYQEAETRINNLSQRFPESTGVQRLERAWDVHNMAELQVKGEYASRPTTSLAGGEGYKVESTLYSAPFFYNWRIFAGQSFAHEAEPNDEGLVGYWRSIAGVEYRNGPLTIDAAPTLNQTHDTSRVGAQSNANWAFNDQWSASLAGELFSHNTPLRAMNRGLHANEGNLGVIWRQNESRSISMSGAAMPFSDGNFRSLENIALQQRLFTTPHWSVDGIAEAGLSQNNKNEARPYYNPASDLLAEAGFKITEILYHRYDVLYQHSLSFTPGLYSEQHFGNSFAYGLRYEQRIQTSDTFEAGFGVGLARQAYDGVYENDINVTVDLLKRF